MTNMDGVDNDTSARQNDTARHQILPVHHLAFLNFSCHFLEGLPPPVDVVLGWEAPFFDDA